MKVNGFEKCKVRLLAKNYNEKKDINYFDTSTPNSRIFLIRVLIALVVVYNLVIH